jgi:hypothetical protein
VRERARSWLDMLGSADAKGYLCRVEIPRREGDILQVL